MQHCESKGAAVTRHRTPIGDVCATSGLRQWHSPPAGAELVARVPIDAALGTWTAVACLDAHGDVVAGPLTAEFAVAAFLLLTSEPGVFRAASVVPVSGTGCPSGNTESTFARIAGTSDDPISLFDQTTPGSAVQLTGGGFLQRSGDGVGRRARRGELGVGVLRQ